MTKENDNGVDNISGVVHYLTRKFDSRIAGWEPAKSSRSDSGEFQTNRTYAAQTEFMYLINEIVRGAPCMVQRNIAVCEEFIGSLG